MTIEQLSPVEAALNRGIEGVIYQSTTDPSVLWIKGPGFLIANQIGKRKSFTVATLPVAATVGAGAVAFVTDCDTPVWGATATGGGATAVPVYSDGSGWLVG